MTAQIIDGKAAAERLRERVGGEVAGLVAEHERKCDCIGFLRKYFQLPLYGVTQKRSLDHHSWT